MSGYRLSLFRYGYTGTAGEAHPLRRVQALIRHRAHEAEVQHDIDQIRTPISIIVRCKCGWSYSQTRRQNARARQAKIDAAIRQHLRI